MSQLSHQDSGAHGHVHYRSAPATAAAQQPPPPPWHQLGDHHHHHNPSALAVEFPLTPVSPTHAPPPDYAQDSPTIGRAFPRSPLSPAHVPGPVDISPLGTQPQPASAFRCPTPTSVPLSSSGARCRKPAPSPLHNTTALPPPLNSRTPSSGRARFNRTCGARDPPITSTTALTHVQEGEPPSSRKTPANSNSESCATPNSQNFHDSIHKTQASGKSLALRFLHDNRNAPDSVKKPLGVSINSSSQAATGSWKMETVKGDTRTSSIDSAISAISNGSSSLKHMRESSTSPADVPRLIKAAGSPEAVIHYLLKEKHSQTQQNSQLWRLVDKQRAMILGLNKDLERALKDKDRYRRKLKEIMPLQTALPLSSPQPGASPSAQDPAAGPASQAEMDQPKKHVFDVPASPSIDSDSIRQSPIDVALAPYPITPPADQCSSGPPAVGEILDPSHTMPEASEHALHHFDHETEEREFEDLRRKADESNDLRINPPMTSSKILPPQLPPPLGAPPSPPRQTLRLDANASTETFPISRLPSPPVPPPRKPPPAPLQLTNPRLDSTSSPEEEVESETDLDDLLEVDQVSVEKRGRPRTRQEHDEMREILVLKDVEARSLLKKSEAGSGAAEETPKQGVPGVRLPAYSYSPTSLRHDASPIATTDVQRGDNALVVASGLLPPQLSPGLPMSPRPMQPGSGTNSPSLTPRHTGAAMPLSPRASRPSLHSQASSGANALKSPQPLNIVKKVAVSETAGSPTAGSRSSPIERTTIYTGFVVDEFPDLLLPPNALPSVMVSVASSRMKPSRASLVSLTQLEEDPVFTLAIHSRAGGEEYWRVEKDPISLAKLDQRLKQCPEFIAKTPDRSLFSGHAPAKLDARRQTLDLYFDELLNTPFDTVTAVEFCRYLSTNVLPPNADEIGPSTDSAGERPPKTGSGGRQLKSGYLTKRGKNFGGWKARFFSIEGPQLKYFETPAGTHLGTIKLPGAKIGRQSHQSGDNTTSPARVTDETENQFRHAFLILEPKKKDPGTLTKHVLCAESDRERDQWVEALLPWTSYQDEEDDDNNNNNNNNNNSDNMHRHEHAHDRQGLGHGHGKGANVKKKTPSRPQQPKDSDESLMGVSYDATKQGDVPTMGGTEYPQPSPAPSLTHYPPSFSISAAAPRDRDRDRDPQVLSDATTWGNKIGGLIPTGTEEKKVRKRSFFGFGLKQRSSSDGTEPLFGDNAAIGLSKDLYTGPSRRVFGAPLIDAVRYNSPRGIRVPLPAVVYRCIQYLDARGGVTEEGIFRLSGSNLVIKQLKDRFDHGGDVNLLADEQYHDIHAVASMLKAYLRELPTSILTRDLHLQFAAVTEMNSQAEKIDALNELVTRLPQFNAILLKYLIAFLIKVISHAGQNKMTVRNVGIVFSPTLTIPAPVFALFLQNYQAIFGILPEEYELPPSAPFEEPREKEVVFDAPPTVRPSTSAGVRESPHRHRLAEALQISRRGNTPPPAAQGGPQFYIRPTFESSVASSSLGPPQYHAAQQRTVNYGYDRPVYESGSAYDHPPSMKVSRRDSSLVVSGPRGIAPQGSTSRLREEP